MKNLHIFFPNLALIIKLKSPSIINKSIINMISHITLKTKQKSINDMDIFFYFSFVYLLLTFVDKWISSTLIGPLIYPWPIKTKVFKQARGPVKQAQATSELPYVRVPANRAGFGPSCWGKNWRAGVRIFTFIK